MTLPTPATHPHGVSPVPRSLWLIAGILLIAANLRAPVTAVGPVMGVLQQTFALSAGAAGLMLTLPLLCFALVSPLAARTARSLGLERTLLLALLLIGAGILLRSSGTVAGLLAGTCIIGCGIAGGNVLLPSLLKRDFADDLTRMTAIYALTMNSVSALGSVCAVPLATRLGWAWALAAFIALPLVAMLAWLPQLQRDTRPANVPARAASIWRQPLAWQVTFFLGTNSLVYYVVTAWLPSILAANGYSAVQAGNLHGLMQLASALPGLLLVPLGPRIRDHRPVAVSMSAATVLSLVGLIAWPQASLVWVPLFGFGTGAVLILGLAFVGTRVSTPPQAAALSAMAQSVGYLLAATGPIVMGRLHDANGGWTPVLALCAGGAVLMGWLGWLAGRPGRVIGASAK
ncbi:CynX/NimT family MFS transporter [Herbaspirillum seropedicae]|uniref:Cyanate permease protein n=1 Tax=Herbaspirillum seropedicae (strain SmR1) TaxID=757424 RepID=D8IUH6_HERSS|nr:MFS transporter [Herbaspirillum seropedicae]ADJ65708.1 cyanate permease protein [Herbaspirillum seropedicae SmR1]AKN67516.1 MFS transporter [Herbaspirillum seropedicae]NQE32105.1 MFS transporter [Herbaspirillum seropedicae]UMU23527.1 CynX/NimT family MFS transporter [Herbaspirillum seropedicae]